MTEPTRDPERQMTYKGRRVKIRETDAGCEIRIEGVPVHVARLAPGSYHSHVLMYQDFPTPESLAEALVDTEGTLWMLPKPGEQGHEHRRE
jgi:hypothetical protein